LTPLNPKIFLQYKLDNVRAALLPGNGPVLSTRALLRLARGGSFATKSLTPTGVVADILKLTVFATTAVFAGGAAATVATGFAGGAAATVATAVDGGAAATVATAVDGGAAATVATAVDGGAAATVATAVDGGVGVIVGALVVDDAGAVVACCCDG
jgi:hypothetical protein